MMISKLKWATVLASMFASGSALPLFAQATEFGSYLAARQAVFDRSYEEIYEYGGSFLEIRDDNVRMLESVISARLTAGQFSDTHQYGATLHTLSPSNQMSSMARVLHLAHNEEYTGILNALDNGLSVSQLLDHLLRAWAYIGIGDIELAEKSFQEASVKGQGFDAFGPFNHALALALAGDFEKALNKLNESGDIGTLAYAYARIQVLSQLNRNSEALNYLNARTQNSDDPRFQTLKRALERNERIPFDTIVKASDAMAEFFYTVALALNEKAEDEFILLYARLAQGIRPNRSEYILLVAELLERLESYALASEAFDLIPNDDPSYPTAELGRASALGLSGKTEAEIEVLKQLTEKRPELRHVHIGYGDALRRSEKYAQAAQAYSRALELSPSLQISDWPLLFTRAISYERMGEWPKAEADLRAALSLSPEQPQVLNYLGYSLLELSDQYDEAMALIRRASAARPQDGYITDSLGWGLYRLGRFSEAVAPMEKAVALEPVDPIINDHLGDVYWAVGREREARFQWQRALSFDPEEKERIRIRRKLEIGLDAVLIEEGREPTRAIMP